MIRRSNPFIRAEHLVRKPVFRGAALVALVAALAVPGALRSQAAEPPSAVSAARLSPQVVLDWNATAVAAVRSHTPAIGQADGLLYMAYVQAAVYDAAAKISGRFVPYHNFSANTRGASLEAAVIAAAYTTLVDYLGDPGGVLAAKYTAAIGALPNTTKVARGIAVGQAAAADIVTFRANDGRNGPVTIAYGAGPLAPGLWTFAPPPSAQFPAVPWLGFMRPFMLKSPSQFQAEPPPALSSAAYAKEFNEEKAYGAANSAVRTPEQTAIAYFWTANVVTQDNQTYRDAAVQHHLDLVQTARLLAMGMLVETDAAISVWNSKYTYQFWRPIMAIRNAGIDGNPATVADPGWTPLVTTPNHPEYVSGHAGGSAAGAEVLAAAFHTERINVNVSGATAAGTTTTHHFATVHDLVSEVINARVWVGFHFRGSTQEGAEVGRQVADWTLERYFQPTSETDDR